ncbi:MAG: carbohydrate ABC transporter permease [Bacillota bacterium]|nr:carbohydrate ABC transporter permease [Bacillota bacterium]
MSDHDKRNAVSAKSLHINRSPWYANLAIHIVFILFSLACLAPLALLVIISLTPENLILQNGYTFFTRELTLNAYEFLFSKPDLVINAYSVTFFIVIVGTFISLFITILYAYPISRMDFPFRNFFSMFIVLTMLFNGGLTATYLVNVRLLHLRNTVWALVLPLIGSAFYILIARTFFRNTIPGELLESARIDGASEGRILFQIVLPLSLPMLATIGLFIVFRYWNDWFQALLYLTDKKLYPLQFVMNRALMNVQYLQQNISTLSSEEAMIELAKMPSESLRMAMAVTSIGPIVIAYPFFQKYFISGLTVGAVKG